MRPIEPICPASGQPSDPDARETSSVPRRHRPGRSSLLAVLAIAAVGVACVAFYAVIRYGRLRADRVAEASGGGPKPAAGQPAAPQPQGRAVSVAPDKAETRTPLVILRVGQGADARPVVALGRPEASESVKDIQGAPPGHPGARAGPPGHPDRRPR